MLAILCWAVIILGCFAFLWALLEQLGHDIAPPPRTKVLICDCCHLLTAERDSVPMISTDWRANGAVCNECANYGIGEEVN